jgi:uncharacterized glyoxalase superfamily protein PhnB
MAAQPVPKGFRTVTPHLVIKDAAKALEFYKKAFGAKEVMRMPGPDGKGVMHAEIQIGDSLIMICDEMPGPEGCAKSPATLKGTAVVIHLYVPDVDAAFKKAVAAGATASMPVTDMFWGDRYGGVKDPFGHNWSIATHKEDLTPQQIGERAGEFFAQMAAGGACKG